MTETPKKNRLELSEGLKRLAICAGFSKIGIADLSPIDMTDYKDWLAKGYHGEMSYLEKYLDLRENPTRLEPWIRSVLVIAAPYPTFSSGNISRYARGNDYHQILRNSLGTLVKKFKDQEQIEFQSRICVDSAPVMERTLAVRAGLGWIGKNGNLIIPQTGSYLFLAEIFFDLELIADTPFTRSYCGSCTACLDSCPGQAIISPGKIDSRRCISYLTIEKKGAIPETQRKQVGTRLFGCDRCQEVCPHNRFSSSPFPGFKTPLRDFSAEEVIMLTPTEFSQNFRHTSIKRTKRKGLLRNAAINLGNQPSQYNLELLQKQAKREEDPLVLEHIRWAIASIRKSLQQNNN